MNTPETNKWLSNLKQVVSLDGEYVATPIKNVFNNKTAYWISKKGYIFAMYMFAAEDCIDQKDLDYRLNKEFNGCYKEMYENLLRNLSNASASKS